MKIQHIKFAVAAIAALIFFTMSAWAQILKPGEIVYSRVATVPGGNCDTAAVWVVGLDGSNDRRITNGLHPRVSPDGRKILFKRFDPGIPCSPFFNGSPEWWIRDLASGVETKISQNFRTSFGHYFSPDTNRADRQITTDDTGQICQMNIDGSNRFCYGGQINPVQGFGHFGVRGDDSLIVFQNYDTSRPSDGGLYTLSYDRTNLQKIPNTSIPDVNPSWSNDGQTVAYASFPGNRTAPYFFTNLFSILPDGSNKTQLTFINNLPATEGFSYSLVWTLDNTTILNAAKLNGVIGIYKIAADGSGTILGRIPITPGAAPDWVGGIVPAYGEKQIASWGGGETSGGNYSLISTIGQAFAGQTSTGGNFNLQSGFWTAGSNKTPFDYDGDGKADISVFRPSSGAWYSLNSTTGFYAVQFGSAADKIVPADYDGDGKTDVAVFRPSIGYWIILGSTVGFHSIQFGSPGDIPAPADYDGDGRADLAVFRPSVGAWFILGSTAGFQAIEFGQSGDVPVAADYDGDGKAEAALFRPSNGAWYELRTTTGFYAVQFGLNTDLPAKADFDGDGKTDVAVFRPESGTWYLLQSTAGFSTVQFGASGDRPAPADFDGDGRSDVAVYRGNNWFVQRSSLGFQSVQFGANGDLPTPAAFVP